jgi:ketosteroid isomerase-like protein
LQAALREGDHGPALDAMRESYRRFDEEGVDAIAEMFHPDFELHMETMFLDGDVYHGADGFRQWREDIAQAASHDRFDAEAIQAGRTPEQFAVLGRLHVIGRASGVELDVPLIHVYEMRDGKTWRLTMYDDADRALAALEAGG